MIFDKINELFQKIKLNKEKEPPLKVYTIIAGVNGAGKTSLFEVLRSSAFLGERVNIDEIALIYGSWRDMLVQIKAGRTAVKKINEYIKNGVCFHQETTLPGPTILKYAKMAKEHGFYIRLYYVGVDSVDTALERVHKRVENGGHGIDDEIIEKRFFSMAKELRALLPLCDEAIFYDNTVRFRLVAIWDKGELTDCDLDFPQWFSEIGLEIPDDIDQILKDNQYDARDVFDVANVDEKIYKKE